MDAAEIDRIRSNLASMRAQDAPDRHLDAYLKSEGFPTLSSWQKAAGITPPPSGPSPGRQALDAVGDAAGTTYDYLRTRGNSALGGVMSIPRMILEGIDWIGRKDGEQGGTGARVPASVLNAFPTHQEAKDILNRPNLPMSSAAWSKEEFNDWLQNDARRPRPETSINPIVDAIVDGVISAPFTGAATMPSFGANIGAPVVSEIAGDAAKDTKLEVPARVIGAILGAAGGAGTGAAIKYGGNVAKESVAPFTEAGRQRLAGQTLRSAAADPSAATAAIDRYLLSREAFPDAVPGFAIDAGKASRDPGLMSAAEVAAAKNPAMRAQVQANNALITDVLDRSAVGLPAADNAGNIVQMILDKRFGDLVKARRDAVDPLYEAARKSPEPVRPFPLLAYTADTVAANKGEPAAVMQKARDLLFTTDKNGRVIADRSARGMMATREALNDMLSNSDLGQYSRSLLLEMKGKVDEALNAVPAAKVANEKFREMSLPLAPFSEDLGNKVVSDVIAKDQYGKRFLMPAEKVPGQFMKGGDLSEPTVQKLMMAAGGDPEVRRAMQAAYIADFRKTAGSRVAEDAGGSPMLTADGAARWMQAHRGGAVNVLTDDQIRALDDITRNLKDQAQTVPGRTGSPTFDRLASDSILSALLAGHDAPSFLHPVQRALNLVYGGANEQTMNILLDAVADPAMAAALMRKATPSNAQIAAPILQQIARGAAVGEITSGERGSR